MNDERKTEKFEIDTKEWNVFFDMEKNPMERGDTTVLVSFINQGKKRFLDFEDLEKLKQDLKDLGKLRIIKQGKEFLE